MKWNVGQNPKRSMAFFSPWFGMDPSDNLNLIQPVNPWMGSSWSYYTEYFQWSPEDNSNSDSYDIEPGQELHGTLVYDETTDSYQLTQTNTATGKTSQQTVKCQNGKKYTIPYVVYEKVWKCSAYPPDEKVTFHDIVIECDGKDCTKDVSWAAKVKDSNCNMQAVIDETNNEISIQWDTTAASEYDTWSNEALLQKNGKGWGARFAEMFRRSADVVV